MEKKIIKDLKKKGLGNSKAKGKGGLFGNIGNKKEDLWMYLQNLRFKLKKVQEFIDDGDKVKMVMKLRGREIGNGPMFVDQLKLMVTGQLNLGKFDSFPKQFGNKIIATVAKAIDKKNAWQ